MTKKNSVFIATSIDGYIADVDGGIDWLHTVPNPDNIDMGYSSFMSRIDAIVMGRRTFETVCSFDIEWPYSKPVFVLSTKLKELDPIYTGKVTLVSGTLPEVLAYIHAKGYGRLYIDGGSTIRSFLKEDLIDEMIITVIPTLLGGGVPLFGELDRALSFHCVAARTFLGQVVQQVYVRVR